MSEKEERHPLVFVVYRASDGQFNNGVLTHLDADHLYVARSADPGARVDNLTILCSEHHYLPHHRSTGSTPPCSGSAILEYVCPPDQLEAVLGDLERNFHRRANKRGFAAARRWYWWQVARSVIAFGIRIVVAATFLREIMKKFGL
jgi:hypothetical protein